MTSQSSVETPTDDRLVEMRSISKSFGGIHALHDVDLTLRRGEVHGLVGENGAGKSTLIKILAGAHQRDSGEVLINGEEITSITPHAMMERGVAVIYQEFMLAPDLTVAENMFIERLQGSNAFIRWGRLEEHAQEQLDSLGFGHISPRTEVRHLTVAEQQIVEICKALARESRVIVFDEPTAVLTSAETRKLLELIKKLRAEGVAVLYVSHRLNELFEVCDVITVLKDGALVDTVSTTEVVESQLVRMMVGRELAQMFPQRQRSVGPEMLRVEDLSSGERVKKASFHVRAGEVVGFAGLVGSGRTELMRAVFGADRATGRVYFDNGLLRSRSPRRSIDKGLGLIPEDRKGQGLALDQSIRFNAGLVRHKTDGYISPYQDRKETRAALETLGTKYKSLEDPVSSLSGGNQQKVSLAKWLTSALRLVIFDEPTRGVDVGAKTEIYKIVEELAREGYAIIVVSSELPEVIGLCDRVYVMREGEVVGELQGDSISEEEIMEYAMGVRREETA